jgi:hypothetical protein
MFGAIFCLYLQITINSHQSPLLNLELAFNRIDEERQLPPALRVLVGGALHLALIQRNAHAGENLPGLLQIDVARLLQSLSLPSVHRYSYSS